MLNKRYNYHLQQLNIYQKHMRYMMYHLMMKFYQQGNSHTTYLNLVRVHFLEHNLFVSYQQHNHCYKQSLLRLYLCWPHLLLHMLLIDIHLTQLLYNLYIVY